MRLSNIHFTDYHPLLDFAKSNHIEFIATNIPRRYASKVARNSLKSLDTLQTHEKKYMMKLPVEVDLETTGYSEMKELLGEHAGSNIDNFIAANAVQDATMAESIFEHHKKELLYIIF